MEECNINKLYVIATTNPKTSAILMIVLILGLLVLCGAGYFAWQKHSDTANNQLQQATVLTETTHTILPTIREICTECLTGS